MFKTRFVTKIIASLATILAALYGAGIVYGVFLQIQIARTAASHGCSRKLAMKLFAEDVNYYTSIQGLPNLRMLRVLADARMDIIREAFLMDY